MEHRSIMRLSRVHATNGLGKRQPKAAKTPQHMRLGIGQVVAGGATRKQKTGATQPIQDQPTDIEVDNDGPIEQKSKHQRDDISLRLLGARLMGQRGLVEMERLA